MKKNLLVLLCMICLIALPLCGCMGETPHTNDESSPIVDQAPAVTDETSSGSDETSPDPNQTSYAGDQSPLLTWENCLEVYYLDVGQGDSTIIRQGDAAMLIDTGERDQRDVVLAALDSLGIDTLDIMVLTHPHTDHMGCAQAVLENTEVKDLYMTDYIADTKTFENLLDTIAAKEMTFTVPKPGSITALGDAEITFLAPVRSYDDCNDSSIALKVTYGENSFLFTGDAEIPAEMDMLATGADFSAQVLQAGHHGSSTSTDPVFFEAVSPEIAVISCGLDNDYGHPHDETLELFEDAKITVFRTDLEGTIFLVSDGTKIIRTEAPNLSGTFSSETIEAGYVGNINSKVLHSSSCGSLPGEANRIYFNTLDAALDSGYKPHAGCIK